MTEPTLGEVMRRLDYVSTQLAGISAQMSDDRKDAAVAFVRKDVYGAESSALIVRVGDIERESQARDQQAAETRRQFVFLVLGLAIPALAALLLAVNNFLAAGGATP